MALIELHGISKAFGGVRALRGVDLTFEAGEVHALLGENGAGKSTLIKILAGALKPDRGEILLEGKPVELGSPKIAKAKGIAVVYQEPMIYPHLSVLENLFMGQEVVGVGGTLRHRAMEHKVLPILQALSLGPEILSRAMGELSVAYQQLVLIAQALLQEARIFIFDEPTSILSREEVNRLLAIIRQLRDSGRSVIYITHRIEEVYEVADRVTVLTDGQVTGRFRTQEIEPEALLELMSGKALRSYARAQPSRMAQGSPLITLEHLAVPPYADDVSFELYRGEVTSLYGLVGSGRSEIALALFGHLPFRGTVRFEGREIHPRSPREAIRLGIGYLPEDRKLQGLFANKNLEYNQTSSLLHRFTHRLGALDLKGLLQFAQEGLQAYGVKAPGPFIAVSTLSGGNQQKVLFTRWARSQLKLLILDEPTRGIDVGTKAEIHRFIRELVDEGIGILVITSDLEEALQISDRIIVMRKGRVVRDLRGPSQPEAVLSAAIGVG
jgi:ribose transport system ATP-binding protein